MPTLTEQVQQLSRVLANPDDLLRAGAAMALGRLRLMEAVELLEKALQDTSAQVRLSAAYGLGQLGLPAVGSLLALLQSPPFPEVPALVEIAMRSVTHPDAVELLSAALEYSEPEARLGAAEALGNIGDPRAIPALAAAARHSHPATRREACLALGRLGCYDPRAMQAATSMLREEDWQLRLAAVQTIGRLVHHLAEGENQVPASEEDFSTSLLQPILTVLQDQVVEIRISAAAALVELRHPSVIGPLLAMLHDSNAWMRQVIAEALGASGSLAANEPLYHLAVEDGDIQVRVSAAQALVNLGDARGRGMLLRTLNAPNAMTRQIAAVGLGLVGDLRALEPLLAGVNEKEIRSETPQGRYLKKRSQEALAALGEPAIAPLAAALASFSPETRKIAAAALLQMGAQAVPGLLKALEVESNRGARTQLVQLLGKIGDPRAVPQLSESASQEVKQNQFLASLRLALFDPDLPERKAAVAALGEIESPEAGQALLAAARYDPDDGVRYLAKLAIARQGDPPTVLALANSGFFGTIYRTLLGLFWLGAVVTVIGVALCWMKFSPAAWITGLVLGAGYGLSGGLAARKRVLQFSTIGLGASFVILLGGLGLVSVGAVPREWFFSIPFAGLVGLISAAAPYFAWGRLPLFERLSGLVSGVVVGLLAAGVSVLVAGMLL